MTVPPTRTPVRIARGSYANLTTVDALASLAEGELAFATDTDQLYAKKGAALVPVSSSGGGSDFSGDYNDLTNKPSIPSTPGDIGAATAAQGALADSAVQPGDNVSGLVNDAGYIGEAPQDGTQYVRNNGAWEAVEVPAGTIIGTSGDLPVTATEGQQWYDLDSGRLFVYTGTEWVDASPDSAAGSLRPGEVNPVYFASQAEFPDPSANHGAIAHSHADGAMYFAHGGVWNRLANASDIPTVNNLDLASLDSLP